MMLLGSWSTALCERQVACWRWMKKEHLRFLHGIQNMELKDKCVILMRYWEATSGKYSEKYSESHVPSGCRINDKNKANYIHTLPSIFCFPQPVLIFLFFFPNRAALSGSIVTSRGLDVHGAALKLSVPGVHDTV